MRISLISAMSRGRVIGKEGGLPFHLPADLRHFQHLTRGKPVVMGRRTWESMDGPLPDRRNLVLSRRTDFAPGGAEVVRSPEEALQLVGAAEELMVCGGTEVYRAFLPLADRMVLTLVHADLPGDTRFPEWDPREWVEVERREREADARNPHAMSFLTYERVKRPGLAGDREPGS